ncbi:hypothetical protein LTR15_002913 [Elasticomyces elasticus]|nr:hypothetical protein LTR15_002913 [Elasticomyces elasticus]
MLLGHSVCAGLLDSALKAVQNIIYTNPSATTLSVPTYANSSAAGLAITTYTPWTSRLSYGIMATIGFFNSPESAHDALQKVLDPNHTKMVVTAQTSPASALDSTAAVSTAATPISLTNEAPHAASASTSFTLISLTTEAPHAELASSATRTPTLITGNPGTVTHIMDFEADATPIVPEFRTAQRSKLHTSTRFESYEDSETSPKMEYWPGYLDILTPFPYLGALNALFFAALFLAVGLALLYSLRAPTHPELIEALKLERTARKYAEKQLRLEKQARKKAEAKLAWLNVRVVDLEAQIGSLPNDASNSGSTPKHTAAPGAYGDDESAPQNEPLPKGEIDDTTTTSDDALAPSGYGSGERATDDRTIPQAGQDEDEPLGDANSTKHATTIEAPALVEYGDDGSVSDHSTIPLAKGDDMHVTQSTEALAGTGGDESVRDHGSIPLAESDNRHATQSVGAPDRAGSDGTVRDHGTIPPATDDMTHVPQSIGALTETRGGAITTDAAISPASGSFTVQTQALPTTSPIPAAKLQTQVKQRQKQTSSPLRPNSAKTGIRKKPLEKPAKRPVRRVDIPLLQQYGEQLVPNATAVGRYGDSEMLMAEPEPEHLPPPPQHDEQPLPMAAAPGLRGDAEIEPPAEQVVDDMAVDDEPVVAAEEQPVEMELDGEGGEQVEGNGERSEQMEVEGADGPAADQQDGKGRDVDAATVADQRQNNVQPPVRLAQLSVAQQGKQERMEQRRKIIAQARDIFMAAKEEKEVNQSKWSKLETIRFDAKLAKLRVDYNNKKDGFIFAYGEDA